MKLGTKPTKPEPSTVPAQAGNNEHFPGFSLNDKLVDEFLDEYGTPKLGTEFTATIKLKVTRLSKESYGSSLGFDILEMNDFAEKKFEDKTDEEQFAQLKEEAERI